MAGDVTVRAARTRGESVLSVSGLDVHQNYVVTAGEQEGRTPAEVIEDYGAARIRSAFALAVPARVRDLFDRLLAEGLPDVPLAYPTDWGIPGPGGTRIDVWVEMALGYLYAVPRRLGALGSGGLADCLAGWSAVDRLWHFLGIDNAFYYGVLCPAVFAAAGMP